MDWREEIWDKIWICGIFWGFWIRGFGGGGKLGDLERGDLGERGFGGILKNLLVRWGVGWIEVGFVGLDCIY